MVSPFDYPKRPHVRKHGPSGYTDFRKYKPWLRDEFSFRCVYCLLREQWRTPRPAIAFAVEHYLPRSQRPELATNYENLLYSCNVCNFFKSDKHLPPDPCRVAYGRLLEVLNDGQVVPTARGNADALLIIALFRLNHPKFVEARLSKIRDRRRLANGASEDDRTQLRYLFGYPDDPPDLRELNTIANSRPRGVLNCFFELRRKKKLPEIY
jgi:hypothetical protein